ncbi:MULTISPECIES: DNA polymerase ligase N-terminal domain-containing protein [Mycobacterium]|uniref:DNA ligase D 3'-phosphoesterase domain-containing protein n=1 Tax=Mycobacterium gordonae TaxID=1778 RepID=A0A1A6B828_MYCGO|nr:MULTISPECIES: DNA polymerase ligase N-terminal domain-containing protein [Mycobacterium]MBI2701017.1 hypothetical protein [Mycobacterium sp.]MBX9980993.1 hypothetical protein [Mycobacterium gordonae]MCQ4361912.1 hypothetical protein [Mycobacterium gordonae]MCV7006036.1 hypothetical protein [Mycobacterium gordonae]OBR98494.1 hypothetical protein A9W98_34910 [Mycobacterium gordonae]
MFLSRYGSGGRHRRQRRIPTDRPCFVVQHQLAHSDHYDFRLEIDGVLVSWKISDGPAIGPTDQRMARRTEDHPLEYATFEGIVPQGRRGPDGVVVWDHGTYANGTRHDMAKGLACGHVSFHLRGDKLRGRYAMTRIREGEEETWLLVRRPEEHAHSYS